MVQEEATKMHCILRTCLFYDKLGWESRIEGVQN